MNYYLGVDVGTSSVKSLLMDSEGKTVGTSQMGYDIIKEKLQYAEQDMEKLWEATRDIRRNQLRFMGSVIPDRCTDWL